MGKRPRKSSILIGLAFGLALSYPPLTAAQITYLQMGVEGMPNPPAAVEVQKALANLKGVDTVAVGVQPAEASGQSPVTVGVLTGDGVAVLGGVSVVEED
ncbi:MAG: hypothetical protein ACE5NC_07460, partial [Anaerolineae bacterium]